MDHCFNELDSLRATTPPHPATPGQHLLVIMQHHEHEHEHGRELPLLDVAVASTAHKNRIL